MAHSDPILVSGATGLVGRRLVAALAARGLPFRALTRDPERAARQLGSAATAVAWNGRDVPPDALRGSAAVVHLAGEPIFGGLPTAARRVQIRASRLESTRSLVTTAAGLSPQERPRALICASAVGYYGSRGEEILEESAPPGSGFLADLCRDWESAARGATAHGLRVISLRIGIVLAREGGALGAMLRPFRLGVGGPIGNGRQWLPWIHADDLVSLIARVLEDESIEGPINAVAPQPVRNGEFARALGSVLHRPALVPIPAFVVRTLLGEFAGEFLDSRRVVPGRATTLGFEYSHPEIESALAAEVGG